MSKSTQSSSIEIDFSLEGTARVPALPLLSIMATWGWESPFPFGTVPSLMTCLFAGWSCPWELFLAILDPVASWLAFVAFFLVGLTSRQKESWTFLAFLGCLEVEKQGGQQWLSVLYEPWPVFSQVGLFLPPQLDLHCSVAQSVFYFISFSCVWLFVTSWL